MHQSTSAASNAPPHPHAHTHDKTFPRLPSCPALFTLSVAAPRLPSLLRPRPSLPSRPASSPHSHPAHRRPRQAPPAPSPSLSGLDTQHIAGVFVPASRSARLEQPGARRAKSNAPPTPAHVSPAGQVPLRRSLPAPSDCRSPGPACPPRSPSRPSPNRRVESRERQRATPPHSHPVRGVDGDGGEGAGAGPDGPRDTCGTSGQLARSAALMSRRGGAGSAVQAGPRWSGMTGHGTLWGNSDSRQSVWGVGVRKSK